MPQSQLTDISVKALKLPSQGQITYWDRSMPGFGVRVSPGGAKTFVLVYGPNRRRTSIGRYPTISLKNARDEAKKLVAELTLGKKHSHHINFKQAKKQFLTELSDRVRPYTLTEYKRHLNSHFRFGHLAMADLTRREVMRKIENLKDRPSEQNHAFTVIRIFLNWAVRNECIERNPLDGIPKPTPPNTRDRFLSADELAVVLNKARDYSYPYGAIVHLLILTGQRRGEIAGLHWEWLNKRDRTITFPASFTKNKREHIIPFGDAVEAVLDSLPVLSETYVFPSRNEAGTTFKGWSRGKRVFDQDLDVAPYTLHDLRRTFSSTHAMLGTPIHVTEKLLNHVSGTVSGVAAIYNRHSYMPEMREAMEKYESYLDQLFRE